MHDTIHMFASSPSFADDGICFAARDSGLYRSDDGGRTWRSAYAQLRLTEPLPTVSVLVSPEFATDRRVYAGVAGGILSSLDGGATWQAATVPDQILPTCLVVSPAFGEDGTILAGTLDHGVLRSGDRGGRWETWNFGLLDRAVLALAISPDYAHDQAVFAGTESGLFRSTNGGRAWRELSLPRATETILSLAISPRYLIDGMLLAGTESAGLFVSNDRGRIWAELGDCGGSAINAIMLGRDVPSEHGILILHGSVLHISADFGAFWQVADVPGLTGCHTTAVAAPLGLTHDTLLLIGSVEGHIARTVIGNSQCMTSSRATKVHCDLL